MSHVARLKVLFFLQKILLFPPKKEIFSNPPPGAHTLKIKTHSTQSQTHDRSDTLEICKACWRLNSNALPSSLQLIFRRDKTGAEKYC